ncbi:hypothetical protein SU32_15920 [Ahrensia marina]|uniref:Copper chaperone PCu(A)C n=2 Tax=Ahrensia marina TaxID=1514904 RepID=A0A0N0E6I7_9HYPH|nr:hypothetical protein SU32_15920 [Ahrensia marina]
MSVAEDMIQSGRVQVQSSWARASVGTMRPTAAYMTLQNTGDQPIVVSAIESEISGKISMHQTVVNAEGISTMRPLKSIDLAPGEKFEFAPGNHHIMIMELKKALVKDKKFSLKLVFEDKSEKIVEVPVLGMGARSLGEK